MGELRFSLRLTWRGTVVLEAKATAVAAFDTARGYFAGNFAGRDLRDFLEKPGAFGPGALDRLLTSPVGEGLGGVYGDDTGSAAFTITREA